MDEQRINGAFPTEAPLAHTTVKRLERKLRTNHLHEAAAGRPGVQLKPLAAQAMVITGATSGIGLVTARLAAQRGARVVLAARSEDALRQLTEEINDKGGEAVFVVADVSQEDDVRLINDKARESFGGFDTWVNNAGVSIYGPLTEVPMDEQRQLFETNFWGLVRGSFAAAQHLRQRDGALINIGSVLSDRAIPLQGMYCASKHAVKGFTDALRMELEHEGAPVSVTLIKPSAIDTPYREHAKNYLETEPNNPPPVYAPEAVAEAILYAAVHPKRDITVGGGGRAISALAHFAPRLVDKVMERTMFSMQHSEHPARIKDDGLCRAAGSLQERGGYEGHVAETSIYTKAAVRPWISGALLLGAGILVGALSRRRV